MTLMQAKDVADRDFLEVVRRFSDGEAPDKVISWPNHPEWMPSKISGPRWALTWDMEEAFPAVPGKVLQAKAYKLIRRGLMDGCPCGCRGDYEITDKGRVFLQEGKP